MLLTLLVEETKVVRLTLSLECEQEAYDCSVFK